MRTGVFVRRIVIVACLCALGSADTGCAKKRAAVEPLPPVTIAQSYPGKAAVDKMRDAIRKLRRPQRPAPAARRPAPPDEQPVGTAGADVASGQPGPTASIGRDAPSAGAGARAPHGGRGVATSDAPEGFDPLVALIVAGWVALLVLLPLAIRSGWRAFGRKSEPS